MANESASFEELVLSEVRDYIRVAAQEEVAKLKAPNVQVTPLLRPEINIQPPVVHFSQEAAVINVPQSAPASVQVHVPDVLRLSPEAMALLSVIASGLETLASPRQKRIIIERDERGLVKSLVIVKEK